MKAVRADIQSGAFAKRFIYDQDAEAPGFLGGLIVLIGIPHFFSSKISSSRELD